jgi:hypothetical protein
LVGFEHITGLDMEIPGSAGQLLIALLFIVPGSVYQAVRQRLRGPAPDDLNFSTKLFRAIGVSTALIALYLAVAGNRLLALVVTRRGDAPSWGGVERHARTIGWLVLLLLLVIPALLGVLDYLRAARSLSLRRLGSDPVPRAWDFAFKGTRSCFVRILTTDGLWLGGWLGQRSFVSNFPEPREVFIEVAHEMEPDGRIGKRQTGSAGMYVRCDDIRAVEFVQRPLASEPSSAGGRYGGSQAHKALGRPAGGRLYSA